MNDTKEYLKEMAERLQPVLLSYFKKEEKDICDIMEYPVKAGGKRIRPILLLLATELVGGSPEKALPAAASVELLHTFTLVHDDMMDHDMERRGKPTVHAIWGDEMGIIVGDTLYSIAFRAMSELKKEGVPDKLIMRSFEELIKANSELHEGQILDMLYSKRSYVKEEEYVKMIGKKTGVLLEASLRIGAIIGNGKEKEINALGEFGRDLGLAFQIKDDILGLTADEKELGKPVGSDICEGKKSLPVLYAIEHASEKDREKLLGILNKKDSCDLVESMRIIKETKSIDYARKKLEGLTTNAKKQLDIFKPSKAKERMLNIADFLIERRF